MERDLKLFGLKRGFKPDALKASWRKLAKERHPDSSPSDPEAHEKFLKLAEAYERLLGISNDENREAERDSATTRSESNPGSVNDPILSAKAEKAYNKAGTAFREFVRVNEGSAEELKKLREAALQGGSLVDIDKYSRFLTAMSRSGERAKTLYGESLTAPGAWKDEAERNIVYLEARLSKCAALVRELGNS